MKVALIVPEYTANIIRNVAEENLDNMELDVMVYNNYLKAVEIVGAVPWLWYNFPVAVPPSDRRNAASVETAPRRLRRPRPSRAGLRRVLTKNALKKEHVSGKQT